MRIGCIAGDETVRFGRIFGILEVFEWIEVVGGEASGTD